ncbi:MAG: type I glyceraldehyde-3-phosphate dehydrogenase [Halanaerobiaceae bacterium]
MSAKIAINGFGRIGRNVFRILHNGDYDLEIAAINDIADAENLGYLLKYDSVHGPFPGEVEVSGNSLLIDGREIEILSVKDPADLPWEEKGVEVVIESTGVFRKREQLEKHLEAGASRVVLTVPSKDKIDNTIVFGVNEDELSADDRIVSNASCTTNCLAPLAKVLNDSFGIEKGLITTVHAYTATQGILDMPSSKVRRGRTAAENIIPTTTGAAIATTRVMPELEGKIDGMAMRVPVPDGSIVDGVFNLGTDVTVDDVNNAVKEAADGPMKGILGYTEDEIVSRDIIDCPYSSYVDLQSTMVIADNQVKVLSWYDNEWGYSNRVLDLVDKLVALG